jgi:L-ascorbate 6-phosphate lactonase
MNKVYKSGERLIREVYDTRLQADSVSFWNLGQAGILIKGSQEDGMICIDPYLTWSIEEGDPETEFKRAFPPILEPLMLGNADGVILTHAHADHFDPATIEGIARGSTYTRFVVPAPHVSLLKAQVSTNNIIAAREQESFRVQGFDITPMPAAHTEYELDSLGDHKSLGYFIEVNGIRLYHSGDTVVTPLLIEQVKEYQPDIAFLPINGRDSFRSARGIIGNMSFREAADFSVTVGADLLVPIHYDLFPNNRENPAYMVDYLFHHYPFQKFHMMAPGERFIYHK